MLKKGFEREGEREREREREVGGERRQSNRKEMERSEDWKVK